MEQSLLKRVYINPNFKRTETDPWPAEQIKTTHFNRHYFGENKLTNTNSQTVTNRKIYVNPNFISGNKAAQSNHNKPVTAQYVKTNENNVMIVPNRQLVHKSKYSLVQNFQQTAVNKEQAFMKINEDIAQTIIPGANQNIKKPTQEVPLSRSRYCIVRKKKRLNNLATDLITTNKHSVPCSNQLTCYTNLNAVKYCVKNKQINNAPEKVTKIKITKYKMVPVSYLRKNAATETKYKKYVAAPLVSYLKDSTKLKPSLITSNKNRFQFVKTSTPVKSSTTVSIIKTARITQHKEKGVMCHGSKAKLSRTKFNINNIPCRLYTKYGKCLRQDRGNCKYLHDKKHVSLCQKFLKGICHDKHCTLSHELSDKKMPTCYFYLKGMCTKECCPYLHVKLSEKAKICREFAKGYCESGDKCLFKHVGIDKLKRSRKLSANSMPKILQNKVKTTKQIKTGEEYTENGNNSKENSDKIMENDVEDCRYYKELVNSDDSYETIKPTRCKLGTLPSFIQL